MRIDGEWYACDDGTTRPVIRADVLAGDGSWRSAEFLLDMGADRAVLSGGLRRILGCPSSPSPDRLAGLGGFEESAVITTAVRLMRNDGGIAVFRVEFAAVPALEALDRR